MLISHSMPATLTNTGAVSLIVPPSYWTTKPKLAALCSFGNSVSQNSVAVPTTLPTSTLAPLKFQTCDAVRYKEFSTTRSQGTLIAVSPVFRIVSSMTLVGVCASIH